MKNHGISRHALTRIGAAGFALTTLSCSYAVAVRPAPSEQVHAFESALPAAAAVFVDTDRLVRQVRITPDFEGDGLCGSARYPLDAREAAELSVIGTLERLMQEVIPTPAPMSREAMEAEGFDLVIVVRADSFQVGVIGDLMPDFESRADLTLAVSAFTREGLQLRELVYGSSVQVASGNTCAGGAEAIGLAVEAAVENAMTELGELIVNSPELRRSLAVPGPV